MENANQQISKKMFRKFFGIFLLLGVFFFIYSIYVLYYGIINHALEGFGIIVLILYLFIIFILFIIFLVLIIINAKRNRKEAFLIISKIAIIGEIFVIICAFGLGLSTKSDVSINKLRKQEHELAKNATSYKDCANMTYFMGQCANVVNEKTGDLQGCINLSIDYAKKGGICQAGGFFEDDPVCLKGFTCREKNTRTFDGHKWNGSNLDSVWVGYADGTYKCKADQYSYCPPTDEE